MPLFTELDNPRCYTIPAKMPSPSNDTGSPEEFVDGDCENCNNDECEYNQKAGCDVCGEACYKEELYSGYCEECLREEAQSEKTALDYARTQEDAASSISAELTWALFSNEYDKICSSFEFFTTEMQAIIQQKLDTDKWEIVNYHQIKWSAISKGIDEALVEFCLNDNGAFAEFLATREPPANISIQEGVAV